MAVICISRQFGAGGFTLAQSLANCLGYEFTDNELVTRVAEKAGVADEWIRVTEREGERRGRGFLTGLFSTKWVERNIGDASGYKEGELSQLFENAIKEISERGNCIFLGRGSQFILGNRLDTVKILLVASEEYRIDFMMKKHNLGREEAARAIMVWERNRVEFLKNFTTKNPNDPSLYDMVINTSKVSDVWTENLICKLIKSRESAEE